MLTQREARPADVLLQRARVVDPASGIDEHLDVSVRDGVIVGLGHHLSESAGQRVVDAETLTVMPAFVDPHVHVRVPGGEQVEDIASATAAAVRGGYCTIVSMPNTNPVVDSPEAIRAIHAIAANEAECAIGFSAAISKGQLGESLTEMVALAEAGAALFTDDGRPVESASLLRRAFQYQCAAQLPIALHCEDSSLSGTGSMHAGAVSARLGMGGLTALGEWISVARDLRIAHAESGQVHIQHLTCAEAVEELSAAKARGTQATGEVSPHHLVLVDASIETELSGELRTDRKVNPPLRTESHREALVEGLRNGTIDIIATDHAPHAAHAKQEPFDLAPFGSIGLETAFAVLYTHLVQPGLVPLDRILDAMTTQPAALLGIAPPRIATGERAQLAVFDLAQEWTVDSAAMASKARNCAFDGMEVRGRCVMTIAGGVFAHDATEVGAPA
jgi:dihydroorotase